MKNIITLTEGKQQHFLPMENITRIEASGSYTIFYMKNGKQYLCCKHLAAVKQLLSTQSALAEIFYRVHRSHLINLKEVNTYEKARGGKVIMSDNVAVAVATRRKSELLKLLKKLK
jgi:two-component system LytT family response regulator